MKGQIPKDTQTSKLPDSLGKLYQQPGKELTELHFKCDDTTLAEITEGFMNFFCKADGASLLNIKTWKIHVYESLNVILK